MPSPPVSVLLPVFNEERFIDDCLESLVAQDYDGDIEIVVAEGRSTDGTLDRLRDWKQGLPGLRVIGNPDRVQSVGLNLAAGAASGEILVRADAHTTYAPDFVQRCVEGLLGSAATAVGGNQVGRGTSPFGEAVAAAMESRLAVGPAPFRHSRDPMEADTVYLGAFRKADFERLGGYRTLPSMVAEDADLYFRWREQGALVMIDPRIRSWYVPRGTVTGHWRQYHRYGLGKADMLYVNGRWPSWRPLGPLLLVLGLIAGLVIGGVWSWIPLLALLGLWLAALALAGRGRPAVMLAAGIMHLAYGIGLIRGLLRRPSRVRGAVT